MGIFDFLSNSKVTKLEQELALTKALLTPKHFREDNNLPYREDSYRLVNGEDYLTLFENHVPVYACVDAIARNCAKVPMKLYSKTLLDSGKKKHECEIKENTTDQVSQAIWKLIFNPNPFQTNYQFRYSVMSTAELTGMAYVEKGGDKETKEVLPNQLWVLRTDWMRTVPSQTEFIEKYMYQTQSGAYVEYTRDEIFEYKYWHPRSEFYGLSPVRPAQNSIILDLYCIKYAKQFFKNGGHISKYVSVKEKLTTAEFERMASEIQTFMGGLESAHKIPLMEGGAELKEIGEDPEKVALVKTRSLNLNDICMAFGVPPIILGLPNETHYNNADAQKKVFYEETVIPKNLQFITSFNQTFLEPLGFVADFDYSEVDVLQPNIEKKANTSAKLVLGKIMTPNEVRKEFWNLDPIKGGDVFPEKNPFSPVNEIVNNPEIDAETGEEVPFDANLLTDNKANVKAGVTTDLTLNGAQITGAIQVIQDYNLGAISQVAAIELLVAVGIQRDKAVVMVKERLSATPSPEVNAFQSKVMKALKEVKEVMTTTSDSDFVPVGGSFTYDGKHKKPNRKLYHKRGRPFHKEKFENLKKSQVASTDKLYNTIYPAMEDAVLNGWKSLEKETLKAVNKFSKSTIVIKKDYIYEVLGSMDSATKRMMQDLIDSQEENLDRVISQEESRTGKKLTQSKIASLKEDLSKSIQRTVDTSMTSVSDTIKKRVQSKLEEALNSDMSGDQITKEIQNLFQGTDYDHAKTIARTESIKYVNTTKMATLNKMGFTQKQWFHSGHSNARPEHEMADGEIVGMDELFSTGLRYPGDPDGEPEDVINCGCTFAEHVDSVLSNEEIASMEEDYENN